MKFRNDVEREARVGWSTTAAAVAAFAVVLGAAAVPLAAPAARAGRTPQPAGPDPESVIAVLGTSPDRFPAGVDTDALIRGGIDRTTLQKLGSDGAQSYWTGLDNAGGICLITILDVRLTTAAACSAPEKVQENGLDLSAEGDSHQPDHESIVAVLVLDSVDISPVSSRSGRTKNPWKKHGSNLVVAKRSEMPSGTTFEFQRRRGLGGPPIRYAATAG